MTLAADGQVAEAQAALAAFGGPDQGGYALLASFQEARLKAEAGDIEAAVAIWDGIAADSSVGPAFQGVATLLAVIHQIDQGDPDALAARLEPLTAAGNAYRPLALELSGLLALRAGDEAGAREHFKAIAEEATASGGVRTRASQMLSVLGGEE